MSLKSQRIARLNKKGIEDLFNLLVKIKNKEQAQSFMYDVFSSPEILDIARRLIAAQFLYEGKTFMEIEDLLGMGSPTINKVHLKTKGSQVLPDLLKN